jgi:carbon-monoxide dehydrogenase iron sulfur subunit
MSEPNRVKPRRIQWGKDPCTHCMSCVVTCSERHTGMSAPSRARLRIIVDLLGDEYAAQYCRQCAKAPCAVACPERAIEFDQQLRAWMVDIDLCNCCGQCMEVCPFDAIWLDREHGWAIKCDLCQGSTRCVEICPSGALEVIG